MSCTNEEAYQNYKKELRELRQNIKPVINSLTMLAEDYSVQKNSASIVRAIEEYIYQVTPDIKILGLYLMDSIIKNLKQCVEYKSQFQAIITRLFADVFECVDEDTRRRLYKLRLTWNEIFTNRVLYLLDISINNIDPAWPIIKARLDNDNQPMQVDDKTPQDSHIPSTTTTPILPSEQPAASVRDAHTSIQIETKEKRPSQSAPVQFDPMVVSSNQIKSNQVIPNTVKTVENKNGLGMRQLESELAKKKPTIDPIVHNNDSKRELSTRDPRLKVQQKTVSQMVSATGTLINETRANIVKQQHAISNKIQAVATNAQKKPIKRMSPTLGDSNTIAMKKPKLTATQSDPAISNIISKNADEQLKPQTTPKKLAMTTSTLTIKQPRQTPQQTTGLRQATKKNPKTSTLNKPKKDKPKMALTKDIEDMFGNEDIDYRSKTESVREELSKIEITVLKQQQQQDEKQLAKSVPSGQSSSSDNGTSSDKTSLSSNLKLLNEMEERYANDLNNPAAIELIVMLKNLITQQQQNQQTTVVVDVVQADIPPVVHQPITMAPQIAQHTTSKPVIPSLFDTKFDFIPNQIDDIKSKSLQHSNSDLPPIKPRDKHDMEDSLLIIDGRSYRIQPDQRRIIKIYYHDHEIFCDTRTKDVYVDSKRVYKMGDSTKEIMLNGRRVRLMYMGKRVELWIDSISVHFRADSPPKQITLTSQLSGAVKRYYVSIDGRTMDMFFNNYKVCNLSAGLRNHELTQTVKLAPDDYELHEISFICPPKRIMIDDRLRTMRYDLPIPCVEIDGEFYIIRFSGNPSGREIYVDDIPYRVPFDKTIRIKINGRAHELAWGGPGYEVIIDGRAYEIQFGTKREVYVGARQHYIRIGGDAPDVKICGRLPDELLQQHKQNLVESHEKQVQQQNLANMVPAIASGLVMDNFNPLDFINKLSKHGLIQKSESATAEVPAPESKEPIPDLTGFDTNLLKQKHNQAIQNLYGGIQCGTCGMRFTNEQSNRYSKHYDWHFRQNKKEKEEINMAHSRSWYYELYEWAQYEELSEDLMNETNADNPSDNTNKQGVEIDADRQTTDQINNQTDFNSTLNNTTITCAATNDIDDFCCICKDPFDIFWDEDREEWYFKDALRVGSKVYHPVCFEDAKDDCQSSVPSTPCVPTVLSIGRITSSTDDPPNDPNESILFENDMVADTVATSSGSVNNENGNFIKQEMDEQIVSSPLSQIFESSKTEPQTP